MKLTDLLLMANSSLFRNKARTFLTVVAIFIGATTLSLTNGIGSGLKAYINRQLGNLGNPHSLTITANAKTASSFNSSGLQPYNPNQTRIVSAGGGPNGSHSIVGLTKSDINKISKIPNVVSVQPNYILSPDYIALSSNLAKKYQFSLGQIFGTSSLDMAVGENASNSSATPEITIPTSYVSSLGFNNATQAIKKTVIIGMTNALGQSHSFQATIVGVQQKTLVGSAQAYGNLTLINELHSFESQGLPVAQEGVYASLTAVYKSNLSATGLSNLQATLTKDGYTGKTIQDRVSTVFTIINAVTYVLDFFAIITLVAASFGIINTLFMSVSERTREIGLMKALGMSKAKIFTLFSLEAVLIGFWGSMLGILFANIIGRVVNSITTNGFLKDFPGLSLLSFPGINSTIIVVVIIAVAFLAGALPARRAAQKDPIEALRYE